MFNPWLNLFLLMPQGRLTTHVLDLTSGKPGRAIRIELWTIRPGTGERHLLKTAYTNNDGRTDAPLLPAEEFAAGDYELIFFVGDYFGAPVAERFLDQVPIRFRIGDANAHYHVPLLTTPWAYQTYRGS